VAAFVVASVKGRDSASCSSKPSPRGNRQAFSTLACEPPTAEIHRSTAHDSGCIFQAYAGRRRHHPHEGGNPRTFSPRACREIHRSTAHDSGCIFQATQAADDTIRTKTRGWFLDGNRSGVPSLFII
jgi:hypothetical protein